MLSVSSVWNRCYSLLALRRAFDARRLPAIEVAEKQFSELSEEQLRKKSLELRFRVKSGESPAALLIDAFALLRVAAQRTVGMRHFDVQLLGGMAMFDGCIAEMQTGEGKTLTATLPVYMHALRGRGAHVATVNDYLARRDAEWMRPVFQTLGLTVGIVQSESPPDARRKAYACDITYGTAKEFGFDFLRDRLLKRRHREEVVGIPNVLSGAHAASGGSQPVQRDLHFALVDEADSVLIDDARTPLIISAVAGEEQKQEAACYGWAAKVASRFEDREHYEYDHEKRKVELTFAGRQLVRTLDKPAGLDAIGFIDMYDFVERAIKVDREFHLDQHYIVRDGEIVIVDESTGRIAEGRKWSQGIHQAIEAKESVEVTVDAGQAARITVQDFFLRYRHLAGMTGTASTSAYEFHAIYKRSVETIPTNRPARRERLADRVFATGEAKWAAIVEEVVAMHAALRPVLIGTRTIDKSEALSRLLSAANIPHQVLNAHRIAEEAEIVSQAGQRGRVMVATNMAGRGTDIKLGEGVADVGGLHVICTELHDSARIDRQLIGRCGRQGDPGSFRFFLALDDDILKSAYPAAKVARIQRSLGDPVRRVAQAKAVLQAAQRAVERRHYCQRRMLLYQEKQYKKMHREMGQDPYLESPY